MEHLDHLGFSTECIEAQQRELKRLEEEKRSVQLAHYLIEQEQLDHAPTAEQTALVPPSKGRNRARRRRRNRARKNKNKATSSPKSQGPASAPEKNKSTTGSHPPRLDKNAKRTETSSETISSPVAQTRRAVAAFFETASSAEEENSPYIDLFHRMGDVFVEHACANKGKTHCDSLLHPKDSPEPLASETANLLTFDPHHHPFSSSSSCDNHSDYTPSELMQALAYLFPRIKAASRPVPSVSNCATLVSLWKTLTAAEGEEKQQQHVWFGTIKCSHKEPIMQALQKVTKQWIVDTCSGKNAAGSLSMIEVVYLEIMELIFLRVDDVRSLITCELVCWQWNQLLSGDNRFLWFRMFKRFLGERQAERRMRAVTVHQVMDKVDWKRELASHYRGKKPPQLRPYLSNRVLARRNKDINQGHKTQTKNYQRKEGAKKKTRPFKSAKAKTKALKAERKKKAF